MSSYDNCYNDYLIGKQKYYFILLYSSLYSKLIHRHAWSYNIISEVTNLVIKLFLNLQIKKFKLIKIIYGDVAFYRDSSMKYPQFFNYLLHA